MPSVNSLLHFITISLVGLVVGVINGLAGGASVISYPVLVATGISPISATMTNALGIWSANLFALTAYRGKVRELLRTYKSAILISIAGAVTGAILLLTLPGKIFEKVVPFLLFFSTLSLLIKAKPRTKRRHTIIDLVLLYLIGVYCGYFGPGQGIMVIVVLARDSQRDAETMNYAKNVIVGIASTVANIFYVFSGQVHWFYVAALFLGSSVGGVLGGRSARRVPTLVYRRLIFIIGISASIWLFIRYY